MGEGYSIFRGLKLELKLELAGLLFSSRQQGQGFVGDEGHNDTGWFQSPDSTGLHLKIERGNVGRACGTIRRSPESCDYAWWWLR